MLVLSNSFRVRVSVFPFNKFGKLLTCTTSDIKLNLLIDSVNFSITLSKSTPIGATNPIITS
ncbi:hypothetical protein GCM10009193_15980 [Shewanella aestuarii]|nr:hypothetical protein GCM10009193_15980 [Shewanella aestuarii]